MFSGIVVAIVEQGQCEIDYLDSRGLGVSCISNVALPYTLPGEIVEFERHRYRRESKCILKSIVTPSPNRIEPKCKYFGICGGCSLQHLNEEDYADFKYSLIKNALLNHSIDVEPSKIIILRDGQRRRVNMEVIKKEQKVFLGFHRYKSHQIINIDCCPATMPELSVLLMPLKCLFSEILNDYQKAQVFLTSAANGIDLTIRPHKPLLLEQSALEATLRQFTKNNGIARLCLQNSKSSKFICEYQTPYIILDEEVEVEIDAHGFLQASRLSDQTLQGLVLQCLNSITAPKKAVDLFCGRGTYTFALSRFCAVDGFESEKTSIEALRKAANKFNRNISVFQRDLFSYPITAQELDQYQFAVINPPRSGSSKQCEMLGESNIEHIVYISCSPDTFSSDAAMLCAKGYQLQKVTPVDQFYWSPHLEVVGFFEKNPSAGIGP